METKSNFWYLNIAILISIVLHAYAIFFIKEFNIDFLDKKKKITVTLSAIGISKDSPQVSVKKEQIIPKEIPKEMPKIIEKKSIKKIKKKIDLKKILPQKKSIKQEKVNEKPKGGTSKGIEGGELKSIISQYVTQIYKLIDAKKKYPRQSLIRKEEGVVMLEITIQSNGELINVKAIKAKYQRLVDSSFDAVENAAPFPAFPKLITRKKMIIQVPVVYKIR